MDSDTVKLVKDRVKKDMGIVNKLTMLNTGTISTIRRRNATTVNLDFEVRNLNSAVQQLAAAVEGIASLLIEHVMAPEKPEEPEDPETRLFTIVALYEGASRSESNEIVVDHYEAKNVEDAINQFWDDDLGGAGDARKDGCQIVSVFHGRLYDLLSTNPCLDEGLISFPQWQEAMKKASARRKP